MCIKMHQRLWDAMAITKAVIVVSVLSFILFYYPLHADAEVFVSGQLNKKEIIWQSSYGVYTISEPVLLEKGSTLTVDAGSHIKINSNFTIKGVVKIKGTSEKPVSIEIGQNSTGFTINGGQLNIDNAKIISGLKLIDAYGSSTIAITNSSIEGRADSYSYLAAISVWQSSFLFLTDSTIKNINAPYGIEAFNGGGLSLKNVFLDKVGTKASMQVFDSSTEFAVADIQSVNFSNSTKGAELFGRVNVEMGDVGFFNMSSSGLLVHSGAMVKIENSSFSQNKIGIESYNSKVTILNSSIENNTEYGAEVSGGSFTSKNNWWGDETGPYHIETNTSGKGNEVEGADSISPWLTEKPVKVKPCCSNILFIPGLEGSRIYKKQLLSENQLWEPNRNADVKKMFLKNDGTPIDQLLYTKDIINRTNIGFGFLDKDVYKGLSDMLDSRVKSKKINEWKALPYDWRMSPDDIVSKPIKTNKGDVHIENIIQQLSSSASNKKVTIIAHSYGGLVAKALINKLEKTGKSSIVDEVILVGTPENGTVESVVSLLHGDDQELGKGFILKADVARTFGINMPAAYYLLPNQSLLNWLEGQVISSERGLVISASSSNSLDTFLTNTELQRVYAKNSDDIVKPANLNAFLLNKARNESEIGNINASVTIKKSNINVIQLIGTGLKTIKNIFYKNIPCGDIESTTPAVAGSLACGLNHELSFTDSGDGVVLTGNLNDRVGSKLVFDLASYNSQYSTNYNHTDMLSARPVVDIIESMLFSGSYPPITGWGDYFKFVPEITTNSNENTNLYKPRIKKSAYQISISAPLLLSAVSTNGKITGMKEESRGYMFPVFSQIPNSSFGIEAQRPYIITDEIPKEVLIHGVTGEVGTVSVGGFKINADSEVLSGTDSTVPQNQKTKLFYFDSVPVSDETIIKIDNIDVGGNTTNTANSSTSSLNENLLPTMHIDRDGDGVFDKIIVYNSGTLFSSTTSVVTTSINTPSASTTSSNIYTNTSVKESPSSLLAKLQQEITSSGISKRFVGRYSTKTKPIDLYIKNNKIQNVLPYTFNVSNSLTAIVKELSRSRDRYYKGGMTKKEASKMYFIWADFLNAFKLIGQ